MIFSSPIFLFGFLPIILLLYYLSPKSGKNVVLLAASLLFYAWGEVFYVFVMLASILCNYVVGLFIYKYSGEKQKSKFWLSLGVVLNLILLISFKYSNFIADNLSAVLTMFSLPVITLEPVHLPLGISFFTFQAISYLVDIYRKEVVAQKSIINLALYISLFPQLIAGPIVRYHDVAKEIVSRVHNRSRFAQGVERFIYGLAKKMLVANPLAVTADSVFALGGEDLTMPLAWLGICAYALQIYFDFSGYTDMAIGLGRMFGFTFLENFNYPYISKSLREFWRRWHISLSTWFRDYLYIPLGGSRVSPMRVYVNLFIVFILTGFWHGATWSFVAWGLFHGVFLAIEHAGFGKVLARGWRPLQHVYLLLVVIFGWVLFRADSLGQALDFMGRMVDFSRMETTDLAYAQAFPASSKQAFFVALILATPIFLKLKELALKLRSKNEGIGGWSALIVRPILLFTLLFLSVLEVASSTYNPFIYFRF